MVSSKSGEVFGTHCQQRGHQSTCQFTDLTQLQPLHELLSSKKAWL